MINNKNIFPIVAIGASAGGLPALESFFKAMPEKLELPISFVVIQHLSPTHKSILAKIIQKCTHLNVIEVSDGEKLQANYVYVIPENSKMTYNNGGLHLQKFSNNSDNYKTIDNFMISLSTEVMDRAIGIIFSGAGNDGTLGIQTIKMNGGMVMAQKPETAQFPSMPLSAINSKNADFNLAPEEMPSHMIAFLSQLSKRDELLDHEPNDIQTENYKLIFKLLQLRTGHDFSSYKPNTIIRRAERRMALHQIENIVTYAKFLQQNPSEVSALFQDLLIGVTNFFRDPEAFKALEEKIIPNLFLNKSPGDTIRIWTVGCSTGEEAYSIIILIQEQMEILKCNFKILLFATDLNPNAINQARTGLFRPDISDFITPERLARFFTLEQDTGYYRINKSLRDMLIFSEHNIIKDPPFSKLDLITCRNLLIYMGADLQKIIISQFNYALKNGGFLFLGSSETPGELANAFVAIDRKLKLYQRIDSIYGIHKPEINNFTKLSSLPPIEKISLGINSMMNSSTPKKVPLRELTEKTLLLQYSPASALVNERFEILYLHGKTSQFLEPAQGEASMSIIKMAKEGLKRDLLTALNKANSTNETVSVVGVKINTNGFFININLSVRVVIQDESTIYNSKLFLVVFEEDKSVELEKSKNTIPSVENLADKDKIILLEQELSEKDDFLNTTKDELQSSNQEMLSNNEELQSTNEELETSKEELQSVNEELATINAELQSKVIDLSHANNDMNNLLAGTGIGTIFVDHNKTIVRFTPTATKLINLIPSDIGRPISHIVSNFKNYINLLSDISSVLNDLVPIETEVQTNLGDWFLMRIRPYRTIENVIEGAVISFFDIEQIKKIQFELEKSNSLSRLAIVVLDANDAILVQDLSGKILAWNPGAERIYGRTESEALGMNIQEMIIESDRAKEQEIIKRLALLEKIEPYTAKRIAKDGSIIEISLTATALIDHQNTIYAISTTERKTGKN